MYVQNLSLIQNRTRPKCQYPNTTTYHTDKRAHVPSELETERPHKDKMIGVSELCQQTNKLDLSDRTVRCTVKTFGWTFTFTSQWFLHFLQKTLMVQVVVNLYLHKQYCAIHNITFQRCSQGQMRTHKYSAVINKSFTVAFLQPELAVHIICLCPIESGKQSCSFPENKLADNIQATLYLTSFSFHPPSGPRCNSC